MATGIALLISESATTVVAQVVSDTLPLPTSDPTPVAAIEQYGIPVPAVDVASVAVAQAASEAAQLLTQELSAVLVALAVTDTLTVGLSDTGPAVPPVAIPASDSLVVQAGEGAPSLDATVASTQFVTASEVLTLRLSDLHSISSLATSVTDVATVGSTTPGFGEDVSIFAFTPQQFVAFSVTDMCVVQVLTLPFPITPKSASDICAVAAVEPQDSALGYQIPDTCMVQGVEGAPAIVFTAPLIEVAVTDSLAIHASDVASVAVTTFDVFLATSDTAGIAIGESTTLISDLIAKFTADTLTASTDDMARVSLVQQPVDESIVAGLADTARVLTGTLVADGITVRLGAETAATDILTHVSLTVSDSVAVLVGELGPLLEADFVFTASDTVALPASEAAPAFIALQAVLAADVALLGASDARPLLAAVSSLAETLAISANDAAALLLKVLAITDSLGIDAGETSSLFSDFVQKAASDTVAVSLTETIAALNQVLTQLATTEALTVGTSEAASVAVEQAVEDLAALITDEALVRLAGLFASDTAAYVVDAENPNILNPSVINVFLAVDDAMALHPVEEDLAFEPPMIGYFVDDGVLVGLEDLAMKENLDLPQTVDFMIEIDYQTQEAPQSFQVTPSKFW